MNVFSQKHSHHSSQSCHSTCKHNSAKKNINATESIVYLNVGSMNDSIIMSLQQLTAGKMKLDTKGKLVQSPAIIALSEATSPNVNPFVGYNIVSSATSSSEQSAKHLNQTILVREGIAYKQIMHLDGCDKRFRVDPQVGEMGYSIVALCVNLSGEEFYLLSVYKSPSVRPQSEEVNGKIVRHAMKNNNAMGLAIDSIAEVIDAFKSCGLTYVLGDLNIQLQSNGSARSNGFCSRRLQSQIDALHLGSITAKFARGIHTHVARVNSDPSIIDVAYTNEMSRVIDYKIVQNQTTSDHHMLLLTIKCGEPEIQTPKHSTWDLAKFNAGEFENCCEQLQNEWDSKINGMFSSAKIAASKRIATLVETKDVHTLIEVDHICDALADVLRLCAIQTCPRHVVKQGSNSLYKSINQTIHRTFKNAYNRHSKMCAQYRKYVNQLTSRTEPVAVVNKMKHIVSRLNQTHLDLRRKKLMFYQHMSEVRRVVRMDKMFSAQQEQKCMPLVPECMSVDSAETDETLKLGFCARPIRTHQRKAQLVWPFVSRPKKRAGLKKIMIVDEKGIMPNSIRQSLNNTVRAFAEVSKRKSDVTSEHRATKLSLSMNLLAENKTLTQGVPNLSAIHQKEWSNTAKCTKESVKTQVAYLEQEQLRQVEEQKQRCEVFDDAEVEKVHWEMLFNMETLKERIRLLNKSSAGFDEVCPQFVKHASEWWKKHLLNLYSFCHQWSILPTQWRLGKVLPFIKDESIETSTVDNLRPICVTSILMRLYERVMYEPIYKQVENRLNKSQAGFLRRRGTDENTVRIEELITRSLKLRQSIPICYIDLRKAFDTVQHEQLLSACYDKGLRGLDLFWIKAFLDKRRISVVSGDEKSDVTAMEAGTPQGAVLSPLLFDIFIDSLITELNGFGQVLAYADDLVIAPEFYDGPDSWQHYKSVMQSMLNCLSRWTKKNKMEVNLKKTKIVIHSRQRKNKPSGEDAKFFYNGALVEVVDSYRYLGMDIESKGVMKLHQTRVLTKVRRAASCIVSMCGHRDYGISPLLIFRAARSLIYGNALYACFAWKNPKWFVEQINSCMASKLKRALTLPQNASNYRVLAEFGLPSYEPLMVSLLCKFVHKSKLCQDAHMPRRRTLDENEDIMLCCSSKSTKTDVLLLDRAKMLAHNMGWDQNWQKWDEKYLAQKLAESIKESQLSHGIAEADILRQTSIGQLEPTSSIKYGTRPWVCWRALFRLNRAFVPAYLYGQHEKCKPPNECKLPKPPMNGDCQFCPGVLGTREHLLVNCSRYDSIRKKVVNAFKIVAGKTKETLALENRKLRIKSTQHKKQTKASAGQTTQAKRKKAFFQPLTVKQVRDEFTSWLMNCDDIERYENYKLPTDNVPKPLEENALLARIKDEQSQSCLAAHSIGSDDSVEANVIQQQINQLMGKHLIPTRTSVDCYEWVLQTDGASKGNGIANAGFGGLGGTIYDKMSEVELVSFHINVGSNATNNETEYFAFILGLQCVLQLLHSVECEDLISCKYEKMIDFTDKGKTIMCCETASMKNVKLDVKLDSKLIVEQFKGHWNVSNKLQPLFNHSQILCELLDEVHMQHVFRKDNKRADELSNIGFIDARFYIPKYEFYDCSDALRVMSKMVEQGLVLVPDVPYDWPKINMRYDLDDDERQVIINNARDSMERNLTITAAMIMGEFDALRTEPRVTELEKKCLNEVTDELIEYISYDLPLYAPDPTKQKKYKKGSPEYWIRQDSFYVNHSKQNISFRKVIKMAKMKHDKKILQGKAGRKKIRKQVQNTVQQRIDRLVQNASFNRAIKNDVNVIPTIKPRQRHRLKHVVRMNYVGMDDNNDDDEVSYREVPVFQWKNIKHRPPKKSS